MTKQGEPLMDAVGRRLKERARLQAEKRKREMQSEDEVARLFENWLGEHEYIVLPDGVGAWATSMPGGCFEVFIIFSENALVEMNAEVCLADGQISVKPSPPTWVSRTSAANQEHKFFLDAAISALGLG